MSISQETVHLTEQAISTSRDHLVYLSSCGLRDYPTVEDILDGANVIAEYLSEKRTSSDIKTYALDFAFSYVYERNQEHWNKEDLSLEAVLSIARKVEGEFPSICPQ